MQWIQHGKNFEAKVPDMFPIAFWVSHKSSETFGYGACVYAGTKLIQSQHVLTPQSGKEFCQAWLNHFISQLTEILNDSAENNSGTRDTSYAVALMGDRLWIDCVDSLEEAAQI